MIRTVEKFQTDDGTIHETHDAAVEHEVRSCVKENLVRYIKDQYKASDERDAIYGFIENHFDALIRITNQQGTE